MSDINMMYDAEKTAPHLTRELVDFIDESFPVRDFMHKSTHAEIMHHFGQRSVVRFLQHKLAEQNESQLSDFLNKDQ